MTKDLLLAESTDNFEDPAESLSVQCETDYLLRLTSNVTDKRVVARHEPQYNAELFAYFRIICDVNA